YVNPLKIYEYLACGKAVLSTYWRELDGFSEVIYFIENSINTKPIIDKIISETTNREIIAKRKQFAQRYDWEILIREAYDKILNHFGK
ncbi:MAG: glycosyltransferase family 1 protein, partial [candidate division WOR-3 bacterium]